jgi:cytochrome P450
MAIIAGEIMNYPTVGEEGLDLDPVYRELQQQGPIKVRLPYGEPCWLATRYDDVRAVHVDRRFGKELGLTHDIPRLRENQHKDPNMLSNMDPPRHARLRRLTSESFSPPRIRKMRMWIDGLVDELLDAMVERGQPADFFSCVSWSLPNLVVTGILGIPRDDVPTFRAWIEEMLATNSTTQVRMDAQQGLRSYILGLVTERRRNPTDDVLGALVEARDQEDRLSEEELVMLCLNLFLGGFETTVAQLGSSVYALMANRQLWQDLLDDHSLMPAALEELWRWIPGHRYGMPLVRWATEDVPLSSGVVIPAGEPILPERVAGNRDEAVFPHARELDFHRENPKPHLSLGFGAHHCVGAPLAHLEIEVTLNKLLSRFPYLELAIPAQEVKWSRTSLMRCVEALPLTW